eukprot:15340580-Ditylum_brightwellii.AAC.1
MEPTEMHKEPREQSTCINSMSVIGVPSMLSVSQPLDKPRTWKLPWKLGEDRKMHCSEGATQPMVLKGLEPNRKEQKEVVRPNMGPKGDMCTTEWHKRSHIVSMESRRSCVY